MFEERYDFKSGAAHFDYNDSLSLGLTNISALKLSLANLPTQSKHLLTARDGNCSVFNTPKVVGKTKPRSKSELKMTDKISKSLEQSKLISSQIEKTVTFKKLVSKSINLDSNIKSRSISTEKETVVKFLHSSDDDDDDDGFEELFNSSSEFENKYYYDRKKLSALSEDRENNEYIHNDDETKEVLHVKFPPWTTSTHGLSRPCSPTLETMDRYYHLLNNCVNKIHLADLSKDWILNMQKQISNKSLFQVHKDYMKLFYEDMHENYYWSIKKAIVDYILKDEEERMRLGVDVVPKVSILFGK